MLGALWHVYRWHGNRKKEALFLSLELNSGKTYNIHFWNFDFANQVRSAIERAFNNTLERSLTFNVNGNNNSINSNNSSIDNSINHSGNNNSGNSSIGHQYNSSTLQSLNNQFNWAMIQEELGKVIVAIQDPNSSVKKASEEALNLAKQKDASTFIDYIKSNRYEFASFVFSNVASSALLAVVEQIIK